MLATVLGFSADSWNVTIEPSPPVPAGSALQAQKAEMNEAGAE